MSGVTTSRMRKREQKMKRIMWANPMIKSAGYDAQQQMLEIEFANNGQIWQFDNVPEDIWYRFRSHHLPELFSIISLWDIIRNEECRKLGRESRHTGNTNRGMKL